MTYKTLYIDDGEDSAVSAYADALQDNGTLTVSVEKPMTFEQEVNRIKANIKDYDAILLDYRLDDFPNEEEITVIYDAPTIAQDIRSKVVKEQIKAVPFILISSDDYIQRFFRKDITSRDLFDLFYSKNEVVNRTEDIVREIKSVIEAYRTTDKDSSIENILKLRKSTLLDDRIIHIYENIRGKNSVYGVVNFVLREMIEVPGPLINELYVAARLGVDIVKSDDWSGVLDNIQNEVQYKGILCEAYPRWWSMLLEKWWKKLSGGSIISLRSSSSEARVNFLKEALKLPDLVHATPLKYATSSKFWTVCDVKKKPIDTTDGLKLFSENTYPWQEQRYVSIIGALEKTEIRKQLLTTEKERLNSIRSKMDV